MWESRDVYMDLVGKPEGKRPLARPRRRWEDNIEMDFQEVGCGDMVWIELAQDRDRWRGLSNAVFQQKRGISRLAENRLAFQEELCSMEYVSKQVAK
jgi:hypothetical protein